MRNVLATVGSFIAMLFVVAACSQQKVSGRELYSANCANCHGRYADGEGPAARDMPGGSVPDLRYLAARNGGFHFKFVEKAWRDTRDGVEFFARLSDEVSRQGGKQLLFTPA